MKMLSMLLTALMGIGLVQAVSIQPSDSINTR